MLDAERCEMIVPGGGFLFGGEFLRCDGTISYATGTGAAGTWSGGCYGLGKYVTVAEDGSTSVIVSSDGLAWSAHSLPTAAYWRDVAASETTYCAIGVTVSGSGSSAATSSDGVTWAASTLPATLGWIGIAWGANLFCAVATYSTNEYATSPDGVNWTSRTFPDSRTFYGIAWNGSVFCVVASSIVYTSSDGLNWVARSLGPGTCYRGCVKSNSAGHICIVNTIGTAFVSIDNGATWVTTVSAMPSGVYVLASNGCSFGAQRFGTTEFYTSADGIAWSLQTEPYIQHNVLSDGVCYAMVPGIGGSGACLRGCYS